MYANVSSPAAPPPPTSYVTWCDPENVDARGNQLSGPCLHGLAWWIWLMLIGGCVVCNGLTCTLLLQMQREGHTPSRLLSFLEAVLAANHSTPSKSRLQSREIRHSRPIYDLVEARNCCCCLPLWAGLALLAAFDLARLAIAIAFAADNLATYLPTGDAGSDVAGLMGAEPRRLAEDLALTTVAVCGIKALLWLGALLSLVQRGTRLLKLLLLWTPVELTYALVFCVMHSVNCRTFCEADVAIYEATGHVGFRRNFLTQMGDQDAADACWQYWRQETAYTILDVVLATVLALYSGYIGLSLVQQLQDGVGRSSSRAARPTRV